MCISSCEGLLAPASVTVLLLSGAPGSGVPGLEVPGDEVPGLDVPGLDVPGLDVPGSVLLQPTSMTMIKRILTIAVNKRFDIFHCSP